MKKPFLSDLQTQLLGQVTDTPEVLDRFSTDAGSYAARPVAVVYPKNTADVRRAVLTALERQAAGKPLPVTARGAGTDLSGGAVGEGLSIVFPSYMNKVFDMDRRTITVQPGANLWTVQQLLHAQARFLPPFPASMHYSTVGGAVAGNSIGIKSVKYGSMRDYVRRVKMVLADGSLVSLSRITARQLHQKKGQTDLEGEIYRQIDSIVTDHRRLIEQAMPKTAVNAAGYALNRVKHADGSIDLAQLAVGSQGTLGLITEIVLETCAWNPRTSLVAGFFDDLEKAGEAIGRLKELDPSSLEMVDGPSLAYLKNHRPEDLQGLVPEETPRLVLLVEFDDQSQLMQLRKARRTQRIMAKYAAAQRYTDNALEQEALWRIRQAAAAPWMAAGSAPFAPVLSQCAVPPAKLVQFLNLVGRMAGKYELELLSWGSAGTGQVWVQPVMELGKKKSREVFDKLVSDYYEAVLSLGGTIAALGGEGLAGAPFLRKQYGDEVYELMVKVKQAFDPNGIFNPLAKFGSADQAGQLRRDSYCLPSSAEIFPG